MSKDLDFVCGAVFSGEDGSADVLGVPFDTTAREDVSAKLQEQWNKFSTLNSVPYDGRYKADDDERLTISNYGDMDGVVAGMRRLIGGETSDQISSFDELDTCRALLFWAPAITDEIMIQRFSRALLLKPGRLFHWTQNVRRVTESYLTISSSLAGSYSLEKNTLTFANVNTIRRALPKFDETYAPGATQADLERFFSNPIFEEKSSEIAKTSDSSQIGRLVWLVLNSGSDFASSFSKVQHFDKILNMDSVHDSKIVFPKDVARAKIILRVLLGDVFESNGNVYLTNSKRPVKAF